MTQVLENVKNAWENFKGEKWKAEIDVRDFILNNVNVYEGEDSFLAEATEATKKLWDQVMDLTTQERENGGVLDMDTEIVSTITSHEPGYLNKDIEKVVGFKLINHLNVLYNHLVVFVWRNKLVKHMDMKWIKKLARSSRDWRKTHNQGVFDAYTAEMKAARKSGIITGLPDAYGRGRIIGDYRRVALYGIDHLIEEKKNDYNLTGNVMSEDKIRLREELSEQIVLFKN